MMPPLFSKLSERRPSSLDYLGVSFGLTSPLHKFWKRAHFAPVYLRQTPNELTGEHSCVMLRPLQNGSDNSWLSAYSSDFHKRFLTLLSYQFRSFPAVQSLSISESATNASSMRSDTKSNSSPLPATELDAAFSPFDLSRLDSYAHNMLDYHVILDLLPQIAIFYFTGRLRPSVNLSGVQQAILLAIGLQRKLLEDVEKELGVPSSQLLAIFVKVVRKVSSHFRAIKENAVAETLPGKDAGLMLEADGGAINGDDVDMDDVLARAQKDKSGKDDAGRKRFEPLVQSLSDDLAEGAGEVDRELKEKQRALVDALPLDL
jgi:N-acetyltransferase 10